MPRIHQQGFLPSIGTLDVLRLPTDVRVDTGVAEGGAVSPFYDPMISKLIAFGGTRDEARIRLAEACDHVATYPVANNAGFLASLLREPDFAEAAVTTGYIGDNIDRLTDKPAASEAALKAAANALFRPSVSLQGPDLPWRSLCGFRMSSDPALETRMSVDGDVHPVTLGKSETACLTVPMQADILLVERGWAYRVSRPQHTSDAADAAGNGTITAPMPGRVVSINVSEGDEVTKGQKLVTLEAMKMEHALDAPFDGVVAELSVTEGAQLMEGAAILKIDPLEDA